MNKTMLLNILSTYNNISIIGMGKNVGKTTVLNYILNEAWEKIPLGLTSIGYDGEQEDQVTLTSKPRIYVEKGTLIATSKELLGSCDITKEIVCTTGMQTPMGEVIIVKALSDGYVELGGPSINSCVSDICSMLKEMGCSLTIVDGALDRRTSASPAITEGTILSTGAAISKSMEKAVELTANTVKLLSTEKEEDPQTLMLSEDICRSGRIGIIDKHNEVKRINVKTSLGSTKELVDALDESSRVIVIKGALQDSLLLGIMQSHGRVKDLKIIVEDGTRLFISPDVLYRFTRQGGQLRTISPINLVCVTCNPMSPFGYEYDKNQFLYRLREEISLPVVDVIGGGNNRLSK